MRAAIACLAAFAAIANAIPQGVTQAIAPSSPAPSGCEPSYPGSFQITVVNVTTSVTKRSLQARDILTLTLSGGILKDAQGRIGYIAANYQFQFDGPPQTGAIYTAGFSVCANSTLALGGSAIWYQCLSGDFYNLYDRHWAPQCNPIYIEAMGASSGGVSQTSDGQPQATTAVSQLSDGQPLATTLVTQRTDGQVYASTGPAPVSVLSDGQPQAPTGKPMVSQISDGQIQGPKPAPITQISDGQIQAPTAKPVSVLSDGQPQAPVASPSPSSKAAVSQISDGQIQAPSATKSAVSQISDGQIQAPPATSKAAVSQISDGQIQAPSATKSAVSQISDGQIQAAASATSTAVAQFTGAASPLKRGDAVAVVAGVAAALVML